jgi:hypothetical protein
VKNIIVDAEFKALEMDRGQGKHSTEQNCQGSARQPRQIDRRDTASPGAISCERQE